MGGRKGEPARSEGNFAKAAKGELSRIISHHSTLCLFAAWGRFNLSFAICHLSCALAIGYWLSDMRASRLPSAPQSVVSLIVMATYIYETVPESTEIPARRFEVRQSMLDAPLTHDPETGQPVRRVISGGFGLMTGSKNAPSLGSSSHSCGSGHCGCC
jgi:predicted nucleic acid-binding Zn ribbon protein